MLFSNRKTIEKIEMIDKYTLKTTFDYINFNYDTHTYYDYNDDNYKSVTRKVHEFFPKFDKENILNEYCLKYDDIR